MNSLTIVQMKFQVNLFIHLIPVFILESTSRTTMKKEIRLSLFSAVIPLDTSFLDEIEGASIRPRFGTIGDFPFL